MTPLEEFLKSQIKANGPISISEYMSICLFHPEHGYYSTREPFGTKGDFITAPEISQMFGELVALSLAQAWMDQGQPSKIALVEFGPGRGTLMADILRTLRAMPACLAACEIHLVEASKRLRDVQNKALQGHKIHHHDTVDGLPSDLPIFAIANEFFDALPIRQMIQNGDGWCERLVGIENDALSFGQSAPLPFAALQHRIEDTKIGDLVEICPAASAIMEGLSQRIEGNGGIALIFDYGDWRSLGDTFQALNGQAKVDPLVKPGQSDLTAHVDFEALVTSVSCKHTKLVTQGVFLERLGITQRAQALAKNLKGAALERHIAAHKRLTHPTEMGTLFKTIALFPKGAPPPPGYEI